jgi:hypothetical protein
MICTKCDGVITYKDPLVVKPKIERAIRYGESVGILLEPTDKPYHEKCYNELTSYTFGYWGGEEGDKYKL